MELHLKKNAAAEIMFAMVDSTTPANLKSLVSPVDTAYSRDGAGAWAALAITDTATEIGTTGMYTIELTAAEMNHDLIVIKMAVAGTADSVIIIRTFTNNIDSILASDLQTIKTQTVTCGAGVTVLASVGTAATSTAQTGDAYAQVGVAGAGLTAVGDTRLANLDTTVSSRLAPAGTLATVTNLTNAPGAGDFTATMKTSLNAATPASVVGAVGSVTADVGITQAGADKVWGTATRALTDKVGFALSAAGVQAIWDALTSALITVGSIGKKLADWVVGTIDTYTGNTKQTADHTAAIADIPTVAEFNARTLPSADYVVVTDTIAGVTLVTTCTTNTDMRGTDNAALASVCTEARLAEFDVVNIPADIDTLLTRLTAARAGYLDELNVATAGSAVYQIDKMMIDIVNKKIITEATGNTEQFSDAGVSLGSIAAAYTTDGTYTTRKRMVI